MLCKQITIKILFQNIKEKYCKLYYVFLKYSRMFFVKYKILV